MRTFSKGQKRAVLSIALALVLLGTAATASAGTIPLFRLFRNPFAAQVSNPPGNSYDSTCSLAGVPSSVKVGERFSIAALAVNTGGATWQYGSVRMAPTQDNPWKASVSMFLYYLQNAGDTGVSIHTLTAPAAAGSYDIELQTRAEKNKEFFGKPCSQSVNVVRWPTVTSLYGSPNPSKVTQKITFSVYVSPADGTGTVSLKEGTGTLATSPLSKGRVVFTINTLPAGTHSLVASFSGNAKYAPSDSRPVTQIVVGIPACGNGVLDPSEQCESNVPCPAGMMCTNCRCIGVSSSSRSSSTSSWNSSASSYGICSTTAWKACSQGFICLATCMGNRCGTTHIDCPQGQRAEYAGTCGNNTCSAWCGRCVGQSSSSRSSSPYSSSSSPFSSSSSSSVACIQEGKTGPVIQFPPSCCTGLKKISVAVANGDMCIMNAGSFLCTKCGDGKCGTGENACNCPADCPRPSSSSSSRSSASSVATGNLFVTLDAMPVPTRQLLGGTLGDTILRLKFHAENEPIDVTLLSIVNGGGAASLDRLELFKEGGTAPFAFATVSSCPSGLGENVYCASMQSQQLVIPKGSDVKLLVKPRLRSDQNGGVSGESIQVQVLRFSSGNDVVARGVDTSNILSRNDGDSAAEGEVFIGRATAGPDTPIVGANNVTVLSKITSIVNANPDANGTSLTAGTKDIGVFKFSAAANVNSKNGLNKVALQQIAFNVASSNVLIDPLSMKIYNKANPAQKVACSANRSGNEAINDPFSGSFFIACGGLGNTDAVMSIDPGASATFAVEANIVNPKISASQGSSLLVSLQNFTSPAETVFNFPSGSHFEWADADSGSPVPPTYLWVEYPDTVVSSTAYQG